MERPTPLTRQPQPNGGHSLADRLTAHLDPMPLKTALRSQVSTEVAIAMPDKVKRGLANDSDQLLVGS